MELKNKMILQIEKAVKEDAKQIIDYLNIVGGESDNLLFGANEFVMSLEAEENYIESVNQSEASALFIGKIEEEIICVGSIMASNRNRIAHHSELAISVKKKYWGMGVGTHLMQTMIDYAKNSKITEILHLGVRSDNELAIQLYKKMGFEEYGRFDKFFKIDGAYYDEVLMKVNLREK